MGYRTYFQLEVNGETSPEHEETISEIYNGGYSLFEDEQSWYDWSTDMKEYSLKYPNLVFKLEGVGEQNDDMWFAYFKNGKTQECPAIITFDEFDESKLI